MLAPRVDYRAVDTNVGHPAARLGNDYLANEGHVPMEAVGNLRGQNQGAFWRLLLGLHLSLHPLGVVPILVPLNDEVALGLVESNVAKLAEVPLAPDGDHFDVAFGPGQLVKATVGHNQEFPAVGWVALLLEARDGNRKELANTIRFKASNADGSNERLGHDSLRG